MKKINVLALIVIGLSVGSTDVLRAMNGDKKPKPAKRDREETEKRECPICLGDAPTRVSESLAGCFNCECPTGAIDHGILIHKSCPDIPGSNNITLRQCPTCSKPAITRPVHAVHARPAFPIPVVPIVPPARPAYTFLDAICHGDLSIVQRMMSDGITNIYERTPLGINALHTAVMKGHVRVVEYLLSTRRFNIDATNTFNDTALHEAATNGNLTIVRMLMLAGANREIRTYLEKTAENKARDIGHITVANFLRDFRQ